MSEQKLLRRFVVSVGAGVMAWGSLAVPVGATSRAPHASNPSASLASTTRHPGAVLASLDVTSDYQIPNGGVTVTNLILDGGTITGPGTITVPAGGSISAPTSSYTSISNATVISNSTTGTVGADALVALASAATFENRGTLTLGAGADLSSDVGSSFVNASSGTVRSGALSALQSASISSRFKNLGTISWSAGTLLLTGGDPDGAADTGTITVAKNAVVEVSNITGAPMVLGSGMTESGQGKFTITGGYVQVPVEATPPSLSSLVLTSGGELDGPGTVVVPSTGTLTVKTGDTAYLNGIHVDLQGTFSFRDASLYFAQGSVLNDLGTLTLGHGASFTTDQSDNQLVVGNGGVLTDAGLANADSVSIDVPLLNQGTVTVASGTMTLTGGTPRDRGGDVGTYAVSSGATLQTAAYQGQSQLLGQGFTVSGSGNFQIAGEVGFVGGVTTPQVNNLQFTNGSLTGPGTLTVNGQLSVSGGTLSGARLIQKATGALDSLTSFCLRSSAVLELRAAFAMGAGSALCGETTSSVVVQPSASLDLSGLKTTESAQVAPQLTNHGMLKVGRASITLGSFTNASDGTIAVTESVAATQISSGTTTLGGTLSLTTDPTFDPAAGTVLPLLAASGVSGTFATVTGTLNPPKRYAVVYGSTSVALRVSAPPSAPQSVVVVPQNGKVTVSWSAPSTGAPITTYTVLLSPSGATCQTRALSCVVSGLTNGATYRATVTATNGSGTGPASTAISAIPATLPNQVTGLSVSQKTTSLVVKWTALVGAATGGRPITSYVVTATGGPKPLSCTTTAATCVIPGVAHKVTLTISIVAKTVIGTSPASVPVRLRTV